MHADTFLRETAAIAELIDRGEVERFVEFLVSLRARKGRLWIAGLGGSAANASHAANDFRKLCGIEAYCLTDNVAEVTARANDEGWERALSLDYSAPGDALLVLSVGGGAQNVSLPLISVVQNAAFKNVVVMGIVGRDGGLTKMVGDCVLVVPTVEPSRVTPHTEGWQGVILHCVVSHPKLQKRATKW